jgi:two-component system LytT family sensor kinase
VTQLGIRRSFSRRSTNFDDAYTGVVTARPRVRTPWLLWLAASAFWTFVGLLYIGQIWWLTRTPGVRMTLGRATWIWQGAFYTSWIPLTVIIWRVTASWDVARLGWARLLARHAAFLIVVSFLQSGIVTAVGMTLVQENETFVAAASGQLRGRLYQEAVMYLAVVMTSQALMLYERSRARELDAAQLEAQLTVARLESLRAQLHPHFLFNSLHTIASLVRDSRNVEAVRLISGMSDLLRRVLDTKSETHTLEEELAVARTYLEVQRTRFGDRLTADICLTDDAAHARVPVLVVQPLVENALRHGLADQVEAGHVSVAGARDGRDLVITVEDNGAGVTSDWRPDATRGTGLANIRGRLQAMYAERGTLAAGPRPGGGFVVTIRLPFAVA